MKEYFGILSGAAAFLALGLSLILWNEHRNAPPPAPFPFFHEFAPTRAEIEEIEAYQKKVETIRAKYHGQIVALLSADQKKAFEASQARAIEAIRQAPFGPNGNPDACRLGPPPEFAVLSMVVYRPVLELLATELKLDTLQRTKVSAILEARRIEVLRLVDSEPLPSFLQQRPPPMAETLP
ncbi:hypothetical protein SAMN05444156_1582 [Verrucomicrobium sp. GAS474]|uniref:hypothetical protein n=1 Tax=Verrucomicrobium sp. GAS474 TaxID=1882831 RepID=UPI00087BCE25|nr:hypothetical protein [Verrucomicrobium sp. GAS474]SDU03589.1 hypothetical protein SAMN05444156_1582 [Verrucomicrobium sp. GAS474]